LDSQASAIAREGGRGLSSVVALGGVALAAIPDSGGTIHGCYQKTSGNLRVVTSSGDCRADENSLAWNQRGATGATGPQGPPGEPSGVKVLRPITLGQGDRQMLFQAGPLTFTAFCKPLSSGEMEANVELTTSQDHAAVQEDFGRFEQRDVLAGQTANIFGPGGFSSTDRSLLDVDFAATAPDRTVVTGIFSLGINLGNDAGKCLFGGHVAVGK
jgi:hypothetical protein